METVRVKRKRRATVGLDFGTSTTKVCVLDEAGDGTEEPIAVVFDRSGTPPTPFFATQVARRGDQLLFGPPAETREDAIRSFKMCLPCMVRAREARSPPCPRCGTGRGSFDLGGLSFTAAEISSLHLSVILSEVLPAVPAMFDGVDEEWRVQINMGSPLDRVGEEARLRRLAESVLDCAARIASDSSLRPSRRWRVDDCRAALNAQPLREVDPDDLSRMTKVYPETHAAMNSVLHQRGRRNGLFALLDVGAGTTDLSFLWLQRSPDGEDRYWTYATGTLERGMDDVDRLLGDGEELSILRTPGERDQLLARIDGRPAAGLHRLQRRLFRHFNTLMNESMNKDTEPTRRGWVDGELEPAVLLVGGGSKCKAYREPLEEEVPAVWKCSDWKHPLAYLRIPASPIVWIVGESSGRLHGNPVSGISDLHVIAHGLARRRVDIPGIEDVN